jgi:hypothetical protein
MLLTTAPNISNPQCNEKKGTPGFAGLQGPRTDGVALLLCCGSGACNDGEAAGLESPADAWYSGSEGVDALDMLAWPDGHCCAALERGLLIDK